MNPLPNQWLSRFPVRVLGNLRPIVRQFDDGSGVSTLIPNVFPAKQMENPVPLAIQPELCTPADFENITFSPAASPLDVGVQYTFSLNNQTGTIPFFYLWFVNDDVKSTSATMVYTFSDAEVLDPDGSNLGFVFITAVLSNNCGAPVHKGGAYQLQGT